MPEPLLQLAPPPAPDPAPAVPPVRQAAKLPELPVPFTPPPPSNPITPPAAPPTSALPPLPGTPVPAVTPAPVSLAVENPGWATKPEQNTKPCPVPPPLPSGMTPTPTATRTDKGSAPPEVKSPEARPAANLPPAPVPAPLPAKASPPAEVGPVLPPATRRAAEPAPVAAAEAQKECSQSVKSMIDTQATERLRRGYPTLADEINHAFPGGQVTLCTVGDKLAVAGQAEDVARATQILQQGVIMLITPELVKPTECRDAAPGGDRIGPGDVEFYLTGRLPARLDPGQRKRFRHCEDVLLAGPQGYSDGR
jgi:hypothetical protein